MDGSTVRIMIFDDRIEVNSPGSLPPGVTIKNIDRKHVLRNKLIVNHLYDIYYIEKWGTGITKMRGLMHEHGLAEPIFEDLKSFFSVTFYGPGEKILNLIPEEGVVDLRELGLNERQIEALRLMVNEGVELSNRAYRDMFAVSPSNGDARLEETGGDQGGCGRPERDGARNMQHNEAISEKMRRLVRRLSPSVRAERTAATSLRAR